MKNIFSGLTAAASLAVCAGCATSSNPATRLADAPSHFARFGTNRIHYVTAGRGGHTLVLVHCWAGNLGFWREQVPALASRARLVLVDLPGHGRSDKPHAAYSMDFFAGAVLAVMRDAGLTRATLVGHSMGVAVICRVFHQAPDRVSGLVAVDGLLRRPDITAEQAERFRAPFAAPDYREHTTRFIRSMFPIPGTETLRDQVLSEILATPQYVMSGAMDGMFGPSQPDWGIKTASVPVLALNAPNPMWTDDYRQYIRSLSPKTDYRTIEGTGHWLMLEKPAEFNVALLEMLGGFGLLRP